MQGSSTAAAARHLRERDGAQNATVENTTDSAVITTEDQPLKVPGVSLVVKLFFIFLLLCISLEVATLLVF